VRAETLKGHLDLLLLAAVEHEPLHGYGIVQELRDRSSGAFDLAEGTVYPALYRLERAGLLESAWSTKTTRRRRLYRLTRRGRKALAEEREQFSRFARAVRAVAGT
jgi:PadR family transcriptional regulator, regulatory protein PadR